MRHPSCGGEQKQDTSLYISSGAAIIVLLLFSLLHGFIPVKKLRELNTLTGLVYTEKYNNQKWLRKFMKS